MEKVAILPDGKTRHCSYTWYVISRERFLLYFYSKKELEQSLIVFLTKRKFWDKYEESLKKIENGENVGGTYWEMIATTKFQMNLELQKPVGNNV